MSVARIEVEGIAWPVSGAQVAIIDAGRVLLQFRPWPPGWEMPGGHCEAGEDPATTAVREVEEETGLHVSIGGLVGVYSWDGLRSSGDVLYHATVAGGRRRRSLEGVLARYVTETTLPRTTFPWIRQRLVDAVAASHGAPPLHRVQPVTPSHIAAFATAWLRAPVDHLLRGRR